MLFVVLLLMTMMMKKSDASELLTARSGDAVLMTSQRLREARLEQGWDVRWTHLHLVMSLRSNVGVCHHKRCTQRSDGSLFFSNVQSQDAGCYSMEVFDASGQRQLNDTFLLEVEEEEEEEAGHDEHGGSSVLVCVPIFLLLVFIVVFIILRRRRSQRTRSTGPLQENVYIVMHGHHGNKMKNVEEKQEREEESHYVRCYPVVSMETQITGQRSVDEEDIYV